MGMSEKKIVFYGCVWDEGWEFGLPAVVYRPKKYRRYSDQGTNCGIIENIVEDICIRELSNRQPKDGCLSEEMSWRRWGERFDRRKDATHVRIEVVFSDNDFEFKSIRTKYGPFKNNGKPF